ncbi:MAG: DUF4332 domain-containing protein [Candidatus Latescibacteria bacterium]|nr:DUF4332 domain-containing protein [Candidatus Latescibacterota bacterium]
MILLLAGPAFIALSFALMLGRVEPFATFFYQFAWYGLILTFDQLIRRRQGRSLIATCGLPGFLALLFWSAVSWYFFELVNLRLQNWYYVFVADNPLLSFLGSVVAFATVFPGIFWIDHYLGLYGVAAQRRGKPLRFTSAGLRNLQLAGLGCLALPLIWPAYFFPLVWLALVLITAPTNYRRGIDDLLLQFERGEYGPCLRLLLAGLIAGLFWESLNFWARAKWIYTVPFFDQLKLFEMPLAGFLGFPPFAVECAVLYRALVWRGLAPAFGAYRAQQLQPSAPALKGVLFLLAALGCGLTHYYMDRQTTTSVTPRLEFIDGLEPGVRALLETHQVRYLTDLEGWQGAKLWQQLEGELAPQQLAELRRTAGLYLHQGIGAEYGNLLLRAGIHSVEALGQLSAEAVRQKLSAVPHQRLPTLAQVHVWVRRAPRERNLP